MDPLLSNPWQINTTGSQPAAMNPYLSQISQGMGQVSMDQNAASQGAQTGQQNISGMQNAINAQSYPSFPNSMGLGTQTGYGTMPTQAPPMQPQNQIVPDMTSRGFNPWSLQGEAMAR